MIGSVIGLALAIAWLLGYVITLWAKYERSDEITGINLQSYLFIWPVVMGAFFLDTRRQNARLSE